MFFWDKPRPCKQYEIRKCDRGEWNKFRRYHYLNNDLSTAAVCWGLYDQNNIIGFCAVLHHPHPKVKNLKRCSRLVILPDYQGIGLGTKFLNIVAQYYHDLHYKFSIVTSAKNMINALRKSDKWVMTRYDTNKYSTNKSAIDYKRKSMRKNCKTASFFFR